MVLHQERHGVLLLLQNLHTLHRGQCILERYIRMIARERSLAHVVI